LKTFFATSQSLAPIPTQTAKLSARNENADFVGQLTTGIAFPETDNINLSVDSL
jgi:hypothetical protein